MRSEHRPAELKCQDCGHEFVASVPHVGHMIDEISQPFRWTIDRIETPCPACGSLRVEERSSNL
jgi:Zn finger protein HypA/HybF involved in hydrogenase expression